MEEVDKFESLGLDVETVGEIIEVPAVQTEEEGDDERFFFDGREYPSYDEAEAARMGRIRELRDAQRPPKDRILLPTLPDYPYFFPGTCIIFNMPEEVYHAIPALSQGGVKKFAGSPMAYWANCAWMNPEFAEVKRLEEERRAKTGADHFNLGHAYHSRILEGASSFAMRFAIALDQKTYGAKLLVTDEDVIGAIAALDVAPVTRIDTGKTKIGARGQELKITRAAKKEDRIEQLLSLDPEALIWDVLVARHREEHAGMDMVFLDQFKRIEFAAQMIERDPELSTALTGGHPEVSLFWWCPRTGLPKKARVDYLKIRAMVDLKTVANRDEMSLDRAIPLEIARRRYILQPAFYFEGGEEVRKAVREQGTSAIRVWEADEPSELIAWAMRWAQHQIPDEWLWIFQQKGIAPVTRGVWFHRASTHKMLASDVISDVSRKFRTFVETCDTEAWLDVKPLYTLSDEDLPNYATEI